MSKTIEEKKNTTEQYKKLYAFTKKKLAIDKATLISCATALKEFAEKQKNELQLFKDDYVYLTFNLNEVPVKHTCRPLQIKLPHPVYSEEYNNQICLIVKDPQRDWKDLVEKESLQTIKKVIAISKLIKKFSTYDKKRQLLNTFDAFICDLRIYKMLPRCLGREFYRKKKFPAPLKLKDPSKDLKLAINSTFFMMGNGPHYSLKIGRVRMDSKSLIKNILTAVYRVIPYLLLGGGVKLSSIQSMSIKTEESPDLPFFNQLSKSDIKSYLSTKQ